MSPEFTMDDFMAVYHRAAADIYHASSSVARRITHDVLREDFLRMNRSLKKLLEAYEQVSREALPGLTIQRLETEAADMVEMLQAILAVSRIGNLDKHRITQKGYHALAEKLEQFKDYWVAFNASTDAELLESLEAQKSEETVPLEFLGP